MSEKLSIKVSAHLAKYVKPDAPAEEKMKVISGEVAATLVERATLLFYLCYDKNQEIKSAALAVIKSLPLSAVTEISVSGEAHPKLKELLARLHPAAVSSVASSPQRSGGEQVIPEEKGTEEAVEEAAEEEAAEEEAAEEEEAEEEEAEEEEAEEEEAEEEEAEEEEAEEEEAEEEEFRSKYQLAQTMGVGEKIKMALTGDKEWRTLLIRDSNKLVNGAVVKNPRITEPEVLTISKSVIQNEEILRVICQNKEWIKNAEIRKALVLNNKTPLPVALRFMGFLSEKDLAAMAKSKNISSVLANQARRMLSNKKKS